MINQQWYDTPKYWGEGVMLSNKTLGIDSIINQSLRRYLL